MLHEGEALSDAADFCYKLRAVKEYYTPRSIRFTQETKVPRFDLKRILNLRITLSFSF